MAEKNDPIPSNAENRDQNPPHNSPVALNPPADENAGASDQSAGASVSTSSDDRVIPNAQVFSLSDLGKATCKLSPKYKIGEGHFGIVYKGNLQTGQIVAVKVLRATFLNLSGEFLLKIIKFSLLRHPNLVNLIGFSVEQPQHYLVYEFMPLGSLDKRLFDRNPESEPLNWETRMRIALGTARGLNYLHSKDVIFNDLKTADIFLDEGFLPRISYYGLAEFGPNRNREPEVVGSEFYNFGVILLELITGHRHKEIVQAVGHNDLFNWFNLVIFPKKERREKLSTVVDRQLRGKYYSEESLSDAADLALLCLQRVPAVRPITMGYVVEAMKRVVSLETAAGGHQRREHTILFGSVQVKIASEPRRNNES